MKEINLLIKYLKPHLNWNQARIIFLAQFLIALIKAGSVNLSRIAPKFIGSADSSSHYKRLQRFFRSYEFDHEDILYLVLTILRIPTPWVLCLDRTNWKFGSININILVLAIAHEGVAIPIFWCFLDKKGISSVTERIQLLDCFLAVFPAHLVAYITADREFRGKKWLAYFKKHQLKPRLRIPNNTKMLSKKGKKKIPVTAAFPHHPQKLLSLKRSVFIWEHPVYVSALYTGSEYVVVISFNADDQRMDEYKLRWQIETLFSCLKTRGFNLEDTHIKDLERLSKLFSLVIIAFCWAYQTGLWVHQKKPVDVKKHGYWAKGFFKQGFEFLQNIFENIHYKLQDFLACIKFLTKTNAVIYNE